MAKKSKRIINVLDRQFNWYVKEEFEDVAWLGAKLTLSILSKDNSFYVKYPFTQKNGENHLVVIGKEFGGEGRFGNTYQRVTSPIWEVDNTITPHIVRSIIEWALTNKPLVFVDYQGTKIEENV
jgi:hypothetical protein